MDPILLAFLIALILIVIAGFIFLFQKIGSLTAILKGEEILQRLELHKGELGSNLRSLDERLHAVTTEIGGVKEVTAQLREFQESLRSQKQRGNVGEMILQDLLRQVLPGERYVFQFEFRNGKRVDAVIKTSGGLLVPVDSKFPVENFQVFVSKKEEGEKQSAWRGFVSDVKKRMDETAGYILPEEGTTPFALMYIPFEPIFQEVVADSELWKYSLEKRVYFTSPQTFWVTLQFLTFALKREQVAERAEDLIKMLHALSKDAQEFDELLRRSASQLSDAKANMDRLLGVFSALLSRLEQLKDLEVKPKESQKS